MKLKLSAMSPLEKQSWMVKSYFIFAGVKKNQFLICEELTGCITKTMTLSNVIICWGTLLVLVSILINFKWYITVHLLFKLWKSELLVNFICYKILKLMTIRSSSWDRGHIGIKSGTKHVIYKKLANVI